MKYELAIDSRRILMFSLAPYDLEFQPETYWPEGFEPFLPEKDPPPVHRMDKGGEVYEDDAGRWHTVAFPNEVVIATFESPLPIYLCARQDGDDIRFRYVIPDDADLQMSPPFLKPGIMTTPEPLTYGDMIYLLDFTVVDETADSPGSLGMAAWLWGIDWDEAYTRIDRLFTMNAAPTFGSVQYPQMRAMYQAVGAHYVQTGEFFDLVPIVEMLAEHEDELRPE